jgi:hypothetical protein
MHKFYARIVLFACGFVPIVLGRQRLLGAVEPFAVLGLLDSVQESPQPAQPQPVAESSAEAILRKAKEMVAAKLAETEAEAAKRKPHDKDKDRDRHALARARAEREHESKQSISSLADDASLKSLADDLSQASRTLQRV